MYVYVILKSKVAYPHTRKSAQRASPHATDEASQPGAAAGRPLWNSRELLVPEPGLSFRIGAFCRHLLHHASSFTKGNFPKCLSLNTNDAVWSSWFNLSLMKRRKQLKTTTTANLIKPQVCHSKCSPVPQCERPGAQACVGTCTHYSRLLLHWRI